MSVIGKHTPRLLTGAFLAPLTPGFLLMCLSLLFGKLGEGLWWFKLSAVTGYPAAVVLGLPSYLLLRKLGWSNLWAYLLAGLLIGVLIAAVIFGSVVENNFSFSVAPQLGKSLLPVAGIFVLAAIFGALSSSIFWLIVRPNRS